MKGYKDFKESEQTNLQFNDEVAEENSTDSLSAMDKIINSDPANKIIIYEQTNGVTVAKKVFKTVIEVILLLAACGLFIYVISSFYGGFSK